MVFFHNIKTLLAPNGEFHTLVRLELYDFDKLLIQQGFKNNTLRNFWDENEHTIDFSKASYEIQSLLKQDSEENRRLISWYIGRGKEIRFREGDISEKLINSRIEKGKLMIMEKSVFSEDSSILYLKIKNIC